MQPQVQNKRHPASEEVCMADRVGIVAVAQTKYHPDRCDVNEEELAWEAIKRVLQETGLSLRDIPSKYGYEGY